MKAVIAGAGRLGQQAAAVLEHTGNEVTLIESDDELADRLRTQLKIRVVTGDACEPGSLEEAGALNADVLIAATGDDEDNLVISLLARRRFDVPRVVARVNHPDNAWLFDEKWGVDVAVSAPVALMSLISEATRAADTVGLLRLGTAGIAIIETTLTDSSGATGRTVSEIRLPSGAKVAAVLREGHAHVPDGSFRLLEGDEVLVVSESATEGDVRAAFQ